MKWHPDNIPSVEDVNEGLDRMKPSELLEVQKDMQKFLDNNKDNRPKWDGELERWRNNPDDFDPDSGLQLVRIYSRLRVIQEMKRRGYDFKEL